SDAEEAAADCVVGRCPNTFSKARMAAALSSARTVRRTQIPYGPTSTRSRCRFRTSVSGMSGTHGGFPRLQDRKRRAVSISAARPFPLRKQNRREKGIPHGNRSQL